MYIPSINKMNDRNEIIAFMTRFSFATIISNKEGVPIATHLPFIIEEKGDELFLISHFAKANEHWKYLKNQTVLVIFSEPHAYISTSNYNEELNVPTWNYLSIHAYGKADLIVDDLEIKYLLQKSIENYELSFSGKWNEFAEEYKDRMIKGIVGFKMSVTDLEAKKKLSQNRTETEKAKIITSLSKSYDTNERVIAEYMENEKKDHSYRKV